MERRSKKTPFSVGDTVLARWLGSNNYYEAKVLTINQSTGSCDVKYEDETVRTLDLKHLKPMTPIPKRSPTTRSSPQRSRSRSGSQSRSRSSSRSRTTKKPKTPQKQSPSTPRSRSRSKNQTTTTRQRSPSRSSSSSTTTTEKKNHIQASSIPGIEDRNLAVVLTPLKLRLRGHTREMTEDETEVPFAPRRLELGEGNPRAKGSEDISSKGFIPDGASDHPIMETDGKKPSSKDDKLLEDDEYDDLEDVKEDISGKKKVRLGGIVGALTGILVLPFLVLNLCFSSTEVRYPKYPFLEPVFPHDYTSYFDAEAYAVFFSWVVVQAFLMLLPIGKRVSGLASDGDKSSLKYRMNGFLALILTLCGMAGLYAVWGPPKLVRDKWCHLACASIAFSFVLSLIVYIKSLWAPQDSLNPEANTGVKVYDFFHGHEINPRLGRSFDLKVYCTRLGFIGWVTLNVALLSVNIKEEDLDYPLLVTVVMQCLYIAATYWQEEMMLTTYSFREEGLGYCTIMGSISAVPFIYSLPTLYLANEPVKTSEYVLIACATLFFLGLYIAKASDKEKHAFRKKPSHPEVSLNSDVILTGKKRNLLSSGWWGFVRHPNYLGEILMFVAWSLPCGFHHWVPYFPVAFVVLVFVSRALTMDSASLEKYGPAWKLYAHRVRWRIFPYVF